MQQERLAVRIRPQTLDEIVGQDDLTKPNSLLRRMVNNEVLYSLIFYGPPGTGKTTMASIIAKHVNADFIVINAVKDKKDDMVKAVDKAQANLKDGKRTIVFIDEIHRFNKAQQDYLLPFVEKGIIILIGATTENPYFEVNNALISRSRVMQFHSIDKDDILKLLDRAMTHPDGLDMTGKTISDDALHLIAEQGVGDARVALNLLEEAHALNDNITVDTVKELIQQPNLLFDKDGNSHYDNISAFIKSMRGSDPDAVALYLARMLEGGEDPMFIARRIVICAAEDVGMANPNALVVANSAMQAVHLVGMPEARIILSEAAIYIAKSPKSNASYLAIDKAM